MNTSESSVKRPSWMQVLALCLIVATISVLLTGYFVSSRYAADASSADGLSADKRDRKLDEIQALLDRYYVGQYEDKDLLDMLAVGYMSGIDDKWAYYTTAEDLEDLYADKSGSYAGIGVTVTQNTETGLLTITEVYPGSPAEEAGIQCLDQLYSVEGEEVATIGMNATVAKVRGEVGSRVNLGILRSGELIEVSVERRTVEKVSVTAKMLDDEIAYLRISEFTAAAAQQFSASLQEMIDGGAKGLIMDVRNNPGGQLTTLISMLDCLMPEGDVFIERDKVGNENRLRVDGKYCDLPLIVLVNEYSYSAAEYFAAVMQEQGRADVAGTATTGKGEGQQTFVLSDGSAITFSVIKYFTPNGVSIGEQGGIQPDLPVEMPDDLLAKIGTLDAAEDPQIAAAVEQMKANVQK